MKRSIIVPLLVLGMTLPVSACQSTDVSSEPEISSSVTTETTESEPSSSFTEVVDGFNYLVVYRCEDGKDKSILSEHFYDANHNEIKSISYDAQDNSSSTTEYEYDDRGNMIKTVYTSQAADSEYINVHEYEYDENNNMIKSLLFMQDDDGNLEIYLTTTISYDSKGNMISRTSENPYGSHNDTYVYEYDIAGRITKCSEYDEDNKLMLTYEYEYDQSGNTIKLTEIIFDASGEYRSIYEYDSNNNLIKISDYYPGSKEISFISEYTYDDKKNILKISHYEVAKDNTYWDEYHYEKR